MRVWVNFTDKEMRLMQRGYCPLDLNHAAVDVVSTANYVDPFKSFKHHYDWFISQWPQQQLALIPATAYVDGGSPEAVAELLQGYFDYANDMNQATCDMEDLGRVGHTGKYDRCRVWIVAGWSSEPYFPHDGDWYSLFWSGSEQFPSGTPILEEWSAEFSKLRRSK
jgi:hypothetical protein